VYFETNISWGVCISIVKTVALAENVIDVDIRGVCIKFFEQLCANLRHRFTENKSRVITIVSSHCIISSGIIQRVPVSHFEISWICIILPVGNTVSDHHTFQIWHENVGSKVCLVVVMDLIDEIWNIDASIRFSGNIKLILLIV